MFDPTNYTIPNDLLNELIAYGKQGKKPGQFVSAVISNQLMQAFARADEETQKAMPQIVKFICNQMPIGCYGSVNNFQEWKGVDNA